MILQHWEGGGAFFDYAPRLWLFSVGLTGDMLRGLIAGLDRELETLLNDE